MDNKDKPIHPLRGGDNSLFTSGDPYLNQRDGNPTLSGLTKREYFAGLAMQGELASQDNDGAWGDEDMDRMACRSILAADALLKALESEV